MPARLSSPLAALVLLALGAPPPAASPRTAPTHRTAGLAEHYRVRLLSACPDR